MKCLPVFPTHEQNAGTVPRYKEEYHFTPRLFNANMTSALTWDSSIKSKIFIQTGMNLLLPLLEVSVETEKYFTF